MHWVLTPAALVAALGSTARFLLWVESRPGVRLDDPLLALIDARDSTWLVFGLLYVSLAAGLAVLARRPADLLVGVQAYVLLLVVRMAVMSLTALDPPAGMIPLRDPFVEGLGTGRVLTRDLFFSGHTATMTLLFLTVPGRAFKAAIGVCVLGVAAGVLRQHVHYTIDVLAAPVFSLACHRAVSALHARRGATTAQPDLAAPGT
jgi:hypothetical protein